ncbi:AraD1 family protein [Glaciimonas sp. PCH181]|uniref:AraD1 family protein n=1 Tax=Glaciimonas sp. PCH181 TaxID=2133943 RepID=UPI000D3C9DF3|nr:AraD1 family protein [Glaciimonas sp. PCH181]PUA16730.1 FAH family protein [Glaciimonas sp. PCH181]
MLLVQLKQPDNSRRIGVLENDNLSIRLIDGYASVYALAQAAIANNVSLKELASDALGADSVAYATVASEGRLLPPLDHADDAHCFVTGTGLTHLGSADGRDAMHKKVSDIDTLTDSMKMFRMGLDGGKPAAGDIGVQPEWFYKGDGSIVRANGQTLTMPHFALDGGEEPEIAALYMIGANGAPYRLGFAIGNEFSDHVTERQNYLYLAHSKLRQCSLGPALLLGELPSHVEGMSRILDTAGVVRWEKPFLSGEDNMSHTIANLEYHHFKYPLFCRPGDVHVHFFGTATLSCVDGITVAEGETFEIDVAAFGPPLRNCLAIEKLQQPVIHAL